MSVTEPLSKILDLLPLHAEEGRLRESVAESALVCDLRCSEAPVVVALLRRIFESLELLDGQELTRGHWAFVSFPAALLARSLVSTWAEPRQSLVESSYWESDGDNPTLAEEQRALLHLLETRRQRFHPTHEAQPIRSVHVAWGLIRLGGKFLLHRREDRSRPHVKQFVLPGGRLRPSDIGPEPRRASLLRDLYAEGSEVARQSMPRTLIRELDEELGLHVDADYKYQFWRRLRPYRAVEGSGNKHALTRYELALFHVRLTPRGENRLLERIATDPMRYPWFSLDDLANGCRPDGATAYIDALHADMGDSLVEQLAGVQDASGTPYRFVDDTAAIDLPAAPGQAFRLGKTGKERDLLVSLRDQDWELVLFLAWCARGLPLEPQANRVRVLGGGWVQLLDDQDLAAARVLALDLDNAKLALLQFAERSVRLAVKPDLVYFSDELFCYAYHTSTASDGGLIELELRSATTRFAYLEGQKTRFPVPRQIASIFEAIEADRDPSSILMLQEAGDLPRQNRDAVTAKVRQLGLRRLIRMPGSDKDMRMVVTVPRTGQK